MKNTEVVAQNDVTLGSGGVERATGYPDLRNKYLGIVGSAYNGPRGLLK